MNEPDEVVVEEHDLATLFDGLLRKGVVGDAVNQVLRHKQGERLAESKHIAGNHWRAFGRWDDDGQVPWGLNATQSGAAAEDPAR